MVRATASSPCDKSHLKNTQYWREIHFGNKVWWISTKGIPSENSDETQQSMSLMKTPGRWSTNKKLTASKDCTPNCCTNAASTTNGWQYPICYFRNEIHLRSTLMDLNHCTHQSKPDNSIITDRSGGTSIQTRCWSAPRSTSKQIDGSPQNQLTAPIDHLKEEPSAPQSLSIFDST